MRDGDLTVVIRCKLRHRNVQRIDVRAAGTIIDLQPVLVGNPAGEHRVDCDCRCAPRRAIVTGLFKDDAVSTWAIINAGDIGIAFQVIPNTWITIPTGARKSIHAGMRPGGSSVTGRVKTLERTAVVVVSTG